MFQLPAYGTSPGEDARDEPSDGPADRFASPGKPPGGGAEGLEMIERTARRLAWGTFALYALIFVASIAFELATKPIPGHEGVSLSSNAARTYG